MTKEIKILGICYILVNIVAYLALSLGGLSFSPSEWSDTLRLIFALFISGTFTGCVCWILFKPE